MSVYNNPEVYFVLDFYNREYRFQKLEAIFRLERNEHGKTRILPGREPGFPGIQHIGSVYIEITGNHSSRKSVDVLIVEDEKIELARICWPYLSFDGNTTKGNIPIRPTGWNDSLIEEFKKWKEKARNKKMGYKKHPLTEMKYATEGNYSLITNNNQLFSFQHSSNTVEPNYYGGPAIESISGKIEISEIDSNSDDWKELLDRTVTEYIIRDNKTGEEKRARIKNMITSTHDSKHVAELEFILVPDVIAPKREPAMAEVADSIDMADDNDIITSEITTSGVNWWSGVDSHNNIEWGTDDPAVEKEKSIWQRIKDKITVIINRFRRVKTPIGELIDRYGIKPDEIVPMSRDLPPDIITGILIGKMSYSEASERTGLPASRIHHIIREKIKGSSLPVVLIKADKEKEEDKSYYSKCLVCKKEVKSGFVRCPECAGSFHYPHLAEWLHVKGTCPKCRRKITVEEPDPVDETNTLGKIGTGNGPSIGDL